ncbi:hypothetical protein [Bradyrhizobium sp. th.b2]|uniref:hypothetical protein n=1 Tax=Bradyrhizobium sp. th-b2 TaxID=172088 RepID=UPI001FD96800|nr:hypothetical protein [Bradyrhizobium sp. th.b2]
MTLSIKDLNRRNDYVPITTEMEIAMAPTEKRALTGAMLIVDGDPNARMPRAFKISGRNPKEIAMSIRSMLVAAAFALASVEAARADGLRPIDAKSIDLGEVSGVAYTVERDGFHVVTTLAQGIAGTPIRVVSVFAPGQSVAFSTPRAGALEISRNGDSVLVRNAKSGRETQ